MGEEDKGCKGCKDCTCGKEGRHEKAASDRLFRELDKKFEQIEEGLCKFCETDPVTINVGILCDECHVGNTVHLFVKCRHCHSNTTFYTPSFDCIGLVTWRLNSGITKQEDFMWTGTGFMLFVDECPNCETPAERVKRESESRMREAWRSADSKENH